MKINVKSTSSRLGLARIVSLHLIALALIFLSLPSSLQAQTLLHRYSFISDASDSVGGPTWNGTIVAPTTGAPATITNGLMLPGNAAGGSGVSGYVSLPAGILTNTRSISVECWLTQNQANTWAEPWDFGNDGTHNFALIPFPNNNGGNMEVAVTPPVGELDIQSDTAFPSGVEQYVVVTFDSSSLVGDLYTNGVLDATRTYPNTNYIPGTIGGAAGTVENTLGNDVYGDEQFDGTIYEFRIWNGVVPQRYIGASALLGSGVVVTNLTPTSISVTGPSGVVVTGTGQAAATVQIAATGTANLQATGDATWSSGNTNILTVNSVGVVTGVSVGTTTVSATIEGVHGTSGNITVTPQTLEHRYSFVTDASDSVGGSNWDGTIVAPAGAGGPATIANGLSLPGNTVGGFGYSGYVSLPSGILTNTSSITVEIWMTQNQRNEWAEVWDFGNNGNQNFGLIPDSNTGNTRLALEPNGGEIDIASSPLVTNAEEYVVYTYNNTSLVGDLYTNGILDGSVTYPNSGYVPAGIGGAAGTTENMLGNDVFGDQQFGGTIYEFRIWNGAVSPLYVAVSGAAGSSVIVTNVTPVSLAVTVTNTTIVGAQTEQATVSGSFAAATGVALTGAATNWTSSNPGVLTVNSSGLITGISGGNATVSATVDGVTATSSSITVALTAPVITQQPAPASAVPGQSANFSVTALGGNLGYQWSEGSTPIAGATNASLTLTDLALTQSGTSYSVKVSNTLGSTNSISVTLTVSTSLLEHRYSFVSDASDSVGGPAWNGTIVAPTTGSPATISSGLNLPGNAGGGFGVSGYVSLPAGILTNTSSIAVECWLTQNQANTWAEPWDFGNNGSQNFALIPFPNNNGGNMEVAFTPHGNEIDVQSDTAFPSGVEEYVALTFDASTLTANLYTNGVLDATRVYPDATYTPGTIGGAGGTVENMLGNDVYGDPQFGGTIYEFRIWNGVVSEAYIAASALAGPSVVVSTNLTPTSISVTAGSGVVITGTEQAAVNITTPSTGSSELTVTGDATNWTSGNTNILTVNSGGFITGVGVGTTTVSATVDGVKGTSGSITVTPQTLVNRYSFATDATDSVGGADGTIVGPNVGDPATISNGLVLPGNTVGGFGYSGYVSLPTGLLLGTTSVTIECWVTQNQGNAWAEIWDFGNNGNQNFALIPDPVDNNGHLEVAFNPDANNIELDTATAFPNGVEQYVVVTYNNSTLKGEIYTNGILDAVQSYPNTSYAPGSIGGAAGTTQNMLGNDVYGDQQFDGTIYEFRIWNGAVSPLYIAVSAAAGPSNVIANLTPSLLTLTVPSTTLTAGQSEQATVTGNFAAASGVKVTDAATNWTSSNPSAIAVSSSGLITSVGTGSATVSATVDGVTATSPSISASGGVALGITVSGSNIVLSWPSGTLLQAPSLLGPWTTNTAAVSPFTNSTAAGTQFYKIEIP